MDGETPLDKVRDQLNEDTDDEAAAEEDEEAGKGNGGGSGSGSGSGGGGGGDEKGDMLELRAMKALLLEARANPL